MATCTNPDCEALRAENERLKAELHMRDQGDVAVLKKRDRWIVMAGKLARVLVFYSTIGEKYENIPTPKITGKSAKEALAEFEAFKNT